LALASPPRRHPVESGKRGKGGKARDPDAALGSPAGNSGPTFSKGKRRRGERKKKEKDTTIPIRLKTLIFTRAE